VKRAAPQSAESTPAVAPPDEQTVAEAKKSETARIDLPATTSERPATRPKTIRIKRPEAAAVKKPLTITRPSVESAATDVGATSEEESVGTIFSALAVAALLVVCVLIYVLAAQTFAPDLPFPGRV
jgi:cobalamin biosynthesis Mg chelatase CobN